MLEKVKFSVDFIQQKVSIKPQVGIILGTGLGGLADEIQNQQYIPYEEIPNFPVSTVKGHKGRLIFGTLGYKQIVAMQGRFHYYEGYPMQELAFPIRVLKFLGIELLILSNATGGVNPNFKIGDIMIVTDHINLFFNNPLIGKNEDELGPRFVDMLNAYDAEIIEKALEIAKKNNIQCHKGVLASVSGPCYETPAEYNAFRILGADAIGMSVIPEVIVARHMGLKCFAISVITDLGVPGKFEHISHEMVIEAAQKAEKKMTVIIKDLLKEIYTSGS